jgi:hypothetical protein
VRKLPDCDSAGPNHDLSVQQVGAAESLGMDWMRLVAKIGSQLAPRIGHFAGRVESTVKL